MVVLRPPPVVVEGMDVPPAATVVDETVDAVVVVPAPPDVVEELSVVEVVATVVVGAAVVVDATVVVGATVVDDAVVCVVDEEVAVDWVADTVVVV